MSANNAALYERSSDSSYTAPSNQNTSNSLFDSMGSKMDQPINYEGLGLKAKKIVEGSGPLQPPIGQTIKGAAKDIDESLLGGYGDYILPTAAGLYGLKKLWDKFGPKDGGGPPNTPPPPGPVAPTAAPAATPPAGAAPAAPATPQLSPLDQQKLRILEIKAEREQLSLDAQKQKLANAQADAEAKKAQQAVKAKQAAGGTITETEAKMLAASETAKITKAVEADQKAQQITSANNQAKAAVAPVAAPAIASGEVSTKTAPVVPKEQHTFKSIADIPEGYVFRPDVGNLDRSLVNILGPEHRLYAKELINEGKMFGHSKDLNKDVSKLTTEYFQKLQGEVPETILSRDARKAQNIESKFGTYGSMLGKAAKVGGVAGTLMTIAQSANAKEAANAVGEALLPWGATPSAVEPGTLTAKQLKAFEEAQKRGSPYRSVPPPTQ